MGRLLGLCAIVLGVWAAAEIYTQGLDRAFGGILASGSSSARAESPQEGLRTGRAADALQNAHATTANRVDRALE